MTYCRRKSTKFIEGPVEFIRVNKITEDNLKAVKASNDAALEELRAAMKLLDQLNHVCLLPIQQEIVRVKQQIEQTKLVYETFRMSVEAIKTFAKWNGSIEDSHLRQQITTHLLNALAHSEEIDYRLCPLNNDEQLYSPDMGVTIEDILKHL